SSRAESLQRAEQRLRAEAQRVGWDALVCRVHEREGVEALGKIERQEAVRLDPDAREEAPVGDADLEHRHGDRLRIQLAQDGSERVEQRQVGLGWAGVVAY